MKYCPECRTQLRMTSIDGENRIACPACEFVYWGNPVPVVASVLIHQGEVVLVRPKYLAEGKWGLPAGYVEGGETAEEAALREIREETSLEAQIEGLIGTYSIPRPGKMLLYMAFLAKSSIGTPKASAEIAQLTTVSPTHASRILEGTTAGSALSTWISNAGL